MGLNGLRLKWLIDLNPHYSKNPVRRDKGRLKDFNVRLLVVFWTSFIEKTSLRHKMSPGQDKPDLERHRTFLKCLMSLYAMKRLYTAKKN